MGEDGDVEGTRVASRWEISLPDLAQSWNFAEWDDFVVLVVDSAPFVGGVVIAAKEAFELTG